MVRRKSKRVSKPRRPRVDVSDFYGQWVALHPRTYRIVGHGTSPDEALRDVPSKRGATPLLYYVPESDAFFVGPVE